MSLLAAIFRLKCPNCHEGNLFNHPNMYHPSHIVDMPKKCSHCGQEYFLEPGFYYGAMYVSYALSVGSARAFLILYYVILDFPQNKALISIFVSLIVILPYQIRLSRSIWLAIFHKQKKVFNDGVGE